MTKTLFLKFDAFSLENSSDIEFMQLFIDVVDAQLLVVVLRKVLKTKNVEQPNCFGCIHEVRVIKVFWLDCTVHHNNQPVKQIVEQLFGKRILIVSRLF